MHTVDESGWVTDIKPGDIWISAAGNRVEVVTANPDRVTYKWHEPDGKECWHSKIPFAFQCRYSLFKRSMEKMEVQPNDRQVGGNHYKQLKPEPWEIMEGWNREHFKGFLRFCAMKRLGRWDSKDNPLQEVEKAIHELQKLAELLREDQNDGR